MVFSFYQNSKCKNMCNVTIVIMLYYYSITLSRDTLVVWEQVYMEHTSPAVSRMLCCFKKMKLLSFKDFMHNIVYTPCFQLAHMQIHMHNTSKVPKYSRSKVKDYEPRYGKNVRRKLLNENTQCRMHNPLMQTNEHECSRATVINHI